MKLVQDGTQQYTYEYDSLYQLTKVDYPDDPSVAYAYDLVGNRTAVTTGQAAEAYQHNRLNQYTWVGSRHLGYDSNGNLTSDGSLTYNDDSQNRLTSVYNNGAWVATYAYDFAGRRRIKALAGGSTTVYVSDADSPSSVLVEYENGTWARAFVYGPGVDEPICMIEPDGDVLYYHYDGLGSVVALSNASGVEVERYHYDAFGRPDQASNLGNPYLFTGREYDPESGLYYYRARMYHPGLGRFMQTDPIGYEDGVNWYAYCGNNPIIREDPSGLSPCCSGALPSPASLTWLGEAQRMFALEGQGIPSLEEIRQIVERMMRELPPNNSGWEPPRNWDGKKRGGGWPDRKGKRWDPGSHKGTYDPHWDVQCGRGYDKVYLTRDQILYYVKMYLKKY